MADYTYGYKPVRILKRDAWEIAFYKMLGKPVEASETDFTGMMKSSMSPSLESMQIWSLCDQQYSVDSPHMMPYKPFPQTDTFFSYAVINVEFPKTISTNRVLTMAEVLIDYTKGYNKNKTFDCSDESVKDTIDQLKKAYTENQKYNDELQEKELSGASKEELERIRKARYRALNECRSYLRSLIIDYLKSIKNPSSLRHILYENGFACQTEDGDKEFVLYKRSASKSKSGSCLFIWKELYEDMHKWSWLDLPVADREIDLTSARAYEALVTSSIIKTVKINPERILLIDPVESGNVCGNIRILSKDEENEDGVRLLTRDEYKQEYGREFENKNKIWDGQALVDESIFERAGYKKVGKKDNRHGMMLLRNRFFKACAFNTRIKEYYKAENIDTVKDMFGNEMKAKDVQMIVTPDSIKLYKFADVFFKGNVQEAYSYWKKHISSVFGIVKDDHASYLGHGNYREVSYQFLNTLPINDPDDINKLLAKDREYLDLMMHNGAVLLHRMHYINASMRNKFFIRSMFTFFQEFANTEYFKNYYLKNERKNYIDNLKNGGLKLKGDFYYLCSMPYEMLEYSAGKAIEPQLEKNQVYIKGYPEGKQVTLIRYPHLSAGSVCVLKSADNENYDQWFNFENKDGTNIVVVSPWNSNIMRILGGCDFDGDSALICEDEVIEKAAKKLMSIEELEPGEGGLPVGVADPALLLSKNDKSYTYTKKDMAILDDKLASSGVTIGSISNNIQLFNSYLWEEYFKGKKANKKRIKAIYECTLILSVLNELAIDSAKHKFAISPEKMKQHIIKNGYNGYQIIEKKDAKKYCPYFLYHSMSDPSGGFVMRDKGEAYENAKPGTKKKQDNLQYWNCPMDLICKSLVSTENTGKWTGTSLDALLEKTVKDMVWEKNDNYSYDQLKGFMLQFADSINESRKPQEGEDESDLKDDQKAVLDRLYSMKCLQKDGIGKIKIKLLKATFEKYKTNKDGHTNNDYKDSEMSNKRRRPQIWGLLFAMEGEDKNGNPLPPSFLKIDENQFRRKELLTEEQYQCLSVKEQDAYRSIDLWGEPWYCDKEQNPE